MIELLVVIVIIAILAALLFPALSRAKASAKAAVCRSTLKQIGLVLNLYVNDYGAYPLNYYYDPTSGEKPISWRDLKPRSGSNYSQPCIGSCNGWQPGHPRRW